MIEVIKELRLNEFKEVHCAKPRDLFVRYGKRESVSFDSNLDEPVPMAMNKIDSIEYLERYDEEMSRTSHDNSSDEQPINEEDNSGK